MLDTIVKPACEKSGFKCERADHFPQELIIEPIVSALASSSLVIADLGNPPWNQNVLMEIGFRTATGRPIVFLSDIEPTPDALPLHLRNHRILKIGEPTDTINDLCSYIDDQKNILSGWKSHYPTIEFCYPMTGDRPAYFTFANEAGAAFYGAGSVEELLSMSVEDADLQLKSYMDDEQASIFGTEQERLMGVAVANREATATVPAWFTKHKSAAEFNRKPYWPILLCQKFSPHQDQSLLMRVAFVNLHTWSGPGQPGLNSSISFPSHFRHREFRHDLFLSHNSADKETVSAIAKAFRRLKLNVWMDEDDIVGQGGLHSELKRAMFESRIIVAVIGPNGLGEWQDRVELRNELLSVEKNKRPFAVVLLDEVSTDDESWIELLPVEYRSVFKNQVYGKLPPKDDLVTLKEGGYAYIERIVALFAATFRESDI